MKAQHAAEWAEARKRCRLSDEAVQMARELGMSPRGLIKNIPEQSEPWKAPVENWVRELYRKRFGNRPRQPLASASGDPTGASRAATASGETKAARPVRNLLREEEDSLGARFEAGELDAETLSCKMQALDRDTPVSGGEIEEQNHAMLRRWQGFREAATAVAAALARIPAVRKVMLFGSVAAPLAKEVPRFRRLRRAGVEIFHECKDVDLAVWVDDSVDLRTLKRASARALNDWQAAHPNSAGVAHHQVDVFLIEPGIDRFLGNLCHYGQCPKGKPECAVPGCGARPFVQLREGFSLDPEALRAKHNATLFDRGAASSAPPDELPF